MNDVSFDQETWNKITPREIEVLTLAALGKTIEETAIDLGICTTTVVNHRQHAIQKTASSNLVEAVATLIRGGII